MASAQLHYRSVRARSPVELTQTDGSWAEEPLNSQRALSRERWRVSVRRVRWRMTISLARHQFPPAIIRHAVWLYLRFTLSYRDVEDLLAERGLDVSYGHCHI